MKKLRLTFLAVVLLMVTAVNAQLSWGVQGGVNLSNLSNVRYQVGLTDAKLGFNIGVLTDFGFTSNMGIRSGLFFTTKGIREKHPPAVIGKGRTDITNVHTTNLMYLQIPIHFAYKVNITPSTRIVFHTGPYVAYGIGGSRRFNGERIGYIGVFGDDESQYMPFDFGIGFGVGFEFGRILTGIGWERGLVDISNFEHGSARNRNAFLTVGYRF
jgi:hypothetical protein